MVVLKRLADAERDGDRIYAVIRGTGVVERRARREPDERRASRARSSRSSAAWRDAGLDPATVGLVEAHGTGDAGRRRGRARDARRVLRPARGDARAPGSAR